MYRAHSGSWARDLGVRYMMAPSGLVPNLYLGGSFASIRQLRRCWVPVQLLYHVVSSCDEGSTVRKVSLARAAPAARLRPHLLVPVSGGR
jgi:hypothetical protein